jgi:hypothetical protein
MKEIRQIALPLALLLLACGDPTSIDTGGLAGTWNAASYSFIMKSDTGVVANLVPRGASYTITFTSGGDFNYTYQDPDGMTVTKSGTYTTEDPLLSLLASGETEPEQYYAIRSDDILTLRTGLVVYDFDGDQIPEDAELRIFLERQ